MKKGMLWGYHWSLVVPNLKINSFIVSAGKMVD
jgi:hypothetical protein